MRRALLLLTLLPLAAIFAGCRSEPQQVFKHPPHVYRNVVSLSPSTTEILLNVVQMPRIAGRTSADNYPPGLVKPVPIVAGTKPDYEKLATLRPDLIVYDGQLYNDRDVAQLRKLGADMFVLTANNWPDLRKQLFELGSLLAGESHVSDYVDKVNIELNAAAAKAPNPAPKVAVILAGPNGSDLIAGADSFLASLIRQCGGKPVGPSGTLFVKMSPEELVKDDPDVILTGGDKAKGDASQAVSLLSDPRLQTVTAIKVTKAHPANPKVVPIDSDVLLRRGTRIDNLIRAIYRAEAS